MMSSKTFDATVERISDWAWARRSEEEKGQDMAIAVAFALGIVADPDATEGEREYARGFLARRKGGRKMSIKTWWLGVALLGLALAARAEIAKSQRCLQELARGIPTIQAQAQAVGVATACVLWVHLGDPAEYHCGAAYRKAMGLNLVEHSSGMYQGKLRISKRGSAQVRRWLYLSVLRLVSKGPVQRWYRQKKSKDGDKAKRALIGVMRKLALALYEVGAKGQTFDAMRLFPGAPIKRTKVFAESATR